MRKSKSYVINNRGEKNLQCILKQKNIQKLAYWEMQFQKCFLKKISKHAWSPLIWMFGLVFLIEMKLHVLYLALCMEQWVEEKLNNSELRK